MVLECPSCGLVSPPGTGRCDCGFAFDGMDTRELGRQNLQRHEAAFRTARMAVIAGLLLLGLGATCVATTGVLSLKLLVLVLIVAIGGLFYLVRTYYALQTARRDAAQNSPPR